MFTLKFDTDNAAFSDADADDDFANAFAKQLECARILESVATRIRGGKTCGFVYDNNGNKVGKFTAG